MKDDAGTRESDFIVRQYGNLAALGLDDGAIRSRLAEVLGERALASLDAKTARPGETRPRGSDDLAAAVAAAGGDAATGRVAFASACDEARVLALAWWRPVRAFLLYAIFLLAAGALLAAFFFEHVLPVFARFSASMGAPFGGTAGWLMAVGGLRLFGPLALLALLIALFGAGLYVIRRRVAALRPLPGLVRWPWLYGRSGASYRVLLVLEYAAVFSRAGVARDKSLKEALRLARWPAAKEFAVRRRPLGDWLSNAANLGTWEAEIDWQREFAWGQMQTHFELTRDRFVFFARIVFYALIGYLVLLLYLPIFSLAQMMGIGP